MCANWPINLFKLLDQDACITRGVKLWDELAVTLHYGLGFNLRQPITWKQMEHDAYHFNVNIYVSESCMFRLYISRCLQTSPFSTDKQQFVP